MSEPKSKKKVNIVVPVLVAVLVATSIFMKPLAFPAPITRYGTTKFCVKWDHIVNNKSYFPWYQQVHPVTIQKEKKFENNTITIKNINEAAISNDKLDYLLWKYGVDSTGMDINNPQQKIDLLLQVSSPNFWAKNYMLHPKAARMSGFVWGHRAYLDEIAAVAALRDINQLKERFPRLAEILSGHSSMEERVLFRFMREYSSKFENDDFKLIEGLTDDHTVIHAFEDQIIDNLNNDTVNGDDECNVVSDILIDLLNKWDKEVNTHFLKEDQNLVHLWINMDLTMYHEFHYSLDYDFFKHLLNSGIFIYRNKMRDTFGI